MLPCLNMAIRPLVGDLLWCKAWLLCIFAYGIDSVLS